MTPTMKRPLDESQLLYVTTRREWRAWLKKHYRSATEIWLVYYKKQSGKPRLAYNDAVEEALCFGWIDGVRHRIDEHAYRIRFTPRKPRGTWSQVNVRRYAELEALGLIAPAGRAAYEAASIDKSPTYSYEKPPVELEAAHLARFQANAKAWAGFQAMGAWYRQKALHHVAAAKTPATRERRLEALIAASAEGRKI
jgi:uncharacterized protein YdeI (YjbR/CyaY-like superfamily)